MQIMFASRLSRAEALKPLDSRSPLFYYQLQWLIALAGKPGEGFTA
jgi:hypothetical protein